MNTASTCEHRTDELLAIRCQMGERRAFDELIARWHAPIWRYHRGLASSDDAAGDLAQETWLKVLRGMPNLRDPARLRAWMFGIARRVAMDRLRLYYARPTDADAALDEIPGPDGDFDLESELAALEAGVAGLPLREREAVVLFYLRELTVDEIAALLAVPAGTIKSRLFRARQMLRTRLTGDSP